MKRFTMAVVLLSLMALGVGPANAQSGHDLFQQALLKERAEGELEEAIQLYGQIVQDFATDRTLAARALVQMGQCYEKLGSQEAERAYRTVVRDFADQPELVAQAEARLAALAAMQAAARAAEIDRQPTFRKIEIASKPQNGVLSPDGTTLAFASGGSLWLVPIHGMVDPYIAGEPVRLTEPMSVYNLGNSLAWSGNGEWIAFNTRPGEGPPEIHVISSRGGETVQVPGIDRAGVGGWNRRISLSPEGKRLAFNQADSLGGSDLVRGEWPAESVYTLPVEGGEAVQTAGPHTRGPAYSPDGRFLAFVRLVEVDDSETSNLHSQVWIRPVDGGAPILVADSIRARGPVWSPDSRLLAFIREPFGNAAGGEVWVVSIAEDGQPVGAPNVISLPRENYHQISGWTPDDELALFMNSETRQALYTVPVGGGRAVQITPNGDFFHPRWMPDGKTVVYRGFFGTWLATVPAEGGESTEIEIVSDPEIIPGIPGGGVHVSPDGRKVLFMGFKRGVQPLEVDIWTVPVEGGPPTQITDSPTQDRYPCWGPDGESIAFLRYREVSEEFVHNLYLVPSDGGEPRAITVDADSVAYAAFAFSPDGEWLAYFSNGALKVRPTEGGEARVVVRPEGVGSHSELAWSPDGQRIAYTGSRRIWITSINGGEPVEVRTGVLSEDAQNLHIDWSPDGERIVFSASMGGEAELWLISDFLR